VTLLSSQMVESSMTTLDSISDQTREASGIQIDEPSKLLTIIWTSSNLTRTDRKFYLTTQQNQAILKSDSY